MDSDDNQDTYEGFLKVSKYATVAVILILFLLWAFLIA